MTFRDVLGGGPAQGVPWHTHDGADISGEIVASTIKAERFLGGVITGKEIIIAGGVDGIIRSDNFVAGATGWRVSGDGVLEAHAGIFRGTLNADDLTAGTIAAGRFAADTIDVSALNAGTIGTHILKLSNSSGSRIESNDGTSLIIRGDGSAVFTDITATGEIHANTGTLGTLTIDGTLTMGSGGVFRTNTSGNRIEIIDTFADRISFYTGAGGETTPGVIVANTTPSLDLNSPKNGAGAVSAVLLIAGGASQGTVAIIGQLRAQFGSVSAPGFSFSDSDTGLYRHGTNAWGLTAGGALTARGTSTGAVFFGSSATGKGLVQNNAGAVGNPTFSFEADTDTGLYRSSTNSVFLATSGVARFGINVATVQSPAIRDNTTGADVAVHITTTGSGDLMRFTSALKYKSRVTTKVGYLADIALIPTKHYRKDDGQWRYGLIADWLTDQDPLLGGYNDDGEVENYDSSAVMAVMAAKINRLEAKLEVAA